MSKILFVLFLCCSLILTACQIQPSSTSNDSAINDASSTNESQNLVEKRPSVVFPIQEFETRITKKPFGIFITPETSPVQPERFSGYHTGVDVEYQDVSGPVPVFAIADGKVEYSGWVAGYGGVMAIRHTIDNRQYLAIYGHLNPDSLVAKGEQVSQGEQIGILGKGYSSETDGERKHLHFGLYTGSDVNLKGYVSTRQELSAWIDPQIFFASF
jgi:murein DD-endopeptidase MepM/ murein hydrolase activator NlpD